MANGSFLADPSTAALLVPAALLFGLVVGSFANVVIHRLPERSGPEPEAAADTAPPLPARAFWSEAFADWRPDWRPLLARWRRVAHPRRSACPRCGAGIRAHDNVPVLSFLLLGGRCRDCRAPISWRYPAVEAGNGFLWMGLVALNGATPRTLALMLFVTALLILALIDFDWQQLPDAITIPGTVAGLAASQLRPWLALDLGAFAQSLAAAAGGYLALALLTFAWLRFRGVEGFGQGDWKMAAMLGAFLGWRGLLLTVFFASLAGSLVGVALMVARGVSLQSKVPFGTFLGFAAVAVILFGEGVIGWYRAFLDV